MANYNTLQDTLGRAPQHVTALPSARSAETGQLAHVTLPGAGWALTKCMLAEGGLLPGERAITMMLTNQGFVGV